MKTKGYREDRAPGYVWFRLLVVVGVFLGVLLLTQAVRNYFVVSQQLEREQAQRDAAAFTSQLEREARSRRLADRQELQTLLDELLQEHADSAAWVRVVDPNEGVIGQSGQVYGPPVTEERMRALFRFREDTADSKAAKAAEAGQKAQAPDPREPGQPELLELDTPPGPVVVRLMGLRAPLIMAQPGESPFSRGGLPREPGSPGGRPTRGGDRFSRGGEQPPTGPAAVTPPGAGTAASVGEQPRAPGGPEAADSQPPVQPDGAPAAPEAAGAQPPTQPRGGEWGGREGRGRGGFFQAPSRFVEVAVFLKRDSPALGSLRRNLTVSVSAGVALLVSMAVLGLRFPHYVRGKQLEQQLVLARQVQQDLLPAVDPTGQEMEFAAQCVPAWQVGGDFYDVFDAGQSRIALVLGDVSGKGLPAALLMGLLHGAVRTASWTASGPEHEEASRLLNRLLYTRTSGERYASMFWGCYDPQTHVLRYINAGHLPPLLGARSADGSFSFQRLSEGGTVLGLLDSADYRQQEARIAPGALLVLCSDGIEEAMNSAGEEFGEERLIGVIQENWGRPAGAIRDAILANVKAFLGGYPAHDDQTLVVARLRSGQPEAEHASVAAEEVLVG